MNLVIRAYTETKVKNILKLLEEESKESIFQWSISKTVLLPPSILPFPEQHTVIIQFFIPLQPQVSSILRLAA